jgi:hypothetical protein
VKIALTVGSSGESQPLISFGDRTLEFVNSGFGGLRDKTLDHRIRKIAKSDPPKREGGIPRGFAVGADFPVREIEESIVESSSGSGRRMILCTWTSDLWVRRAASGVDENLKDPSSKRLNLAPLTKYMKFVAKFVSLPLHTSNTLDGLHKSLPLLLLKTSKQNDTPPAPPIFLSFSKKSRFKKK